MVLDMSLNSKSLDTSGMNDYFTRVRDESQPRLRICFDPEQEIPLLQKWFAMNNHPSRTQVSTSRYTDHGVLLMYSLKVEHYTNILNSAAGRAGRPKLDVHNIIYWFKNTRAALRRAEIRAVRAPSLISCEGPAKHGGEMELLSFTVIQQMHSFQGSESARGRDCEDEDEIFEINENKILDSHWHISIEKLKSENFSQEDLVPQPNFSFSKERKVSDESKNTFDISHQKNISD